MVQCKTPWGKKFLTTVDVCLDHAGEVAKETVEALAKKDPKVINPPISHVVASNCIDLKKDKCLGPNAVMHADLTYSPLGCKENVTQTQIGSKNLQFGGSFKIFNVEQKPILSNEDVLRASLSKALSCNELKVTALTPFTMKVTDIDYYNCLKKYLIDNKIHFLSDSINKNIKIDDAFFHYPPPQNATATVSKVINLFHSLPGEKQRLI